VTVTGSPPQGDVTELLLGSPPYAATQLYVPPAPTVTLPEEAVPPLTVPVLVAIGVVQVVSPGAYRVKTTLPPGEKPPVRVAESETLPPAGTEPDGVVAMEGVAFVTTTGSLPHGDVAELLLASPLYVATQL